MKQVLCTLDLQDYETDSQPVKPTPLLLRLVEKIGGQVDVKLTTKAIKISPVFVGSRVI